MAGVQVINITGELFNIPRHLEAESGSLTYSFNTSSNTLDQALHNKFGINFDEVNPVIKSAVSDMNYATGDAGNLYVQGQYNAMKVSYNGCVGINCEQMIHDHDNLIGSIIESAHLFKSINPNAADVCIGGPEDQNKLILEKVASLSGLQVLNPSDIRLEDLNPELSMQVDSMWKQYQDTYKDRAPVASVSSSADQNNTPLNENNSVNALAM